MNKTNFSKQNILLAVLLVFIVAFVFVKEAGSQFSGSSLKETENILSGDSAHWNNSIPCLTCHVLNNAPGDQLTAIAGNANLCMSCHNPAGMASNTPFTNADRAEPGIGGTSHAWNKPAINEEYGASLPTNSNMANKVMYDEIVCSTCHNPHADNYPPFLRISNDQDAMCKDCHTVRNVGTYSDDTTNKGSHPVGKIYPAADPRFYATPQDPDIILIGSQVECSSCHGIHYTNSGGANNGTGDGYLLRTTNDDNLCTTCHTYTGHQGMSCSQCHQTHNPKRDNIFMTKDTLLTPNDGLKPVLFYRESGPNSYADGDATYDGVCEVCHTTTDYYRNNSSGNHVHNRGISCVVCHPHSVEFAPQGGCTSCHSYTQDNLDGIPVGGRRPVAGEFPTGNSHAHYGGTLDDNDCKVCHSLTNHKGGYVELINLDDGSILSFLKPDSIHTDPDVSNFCQACHDADGALLSADPFDPFGNGNAAPDVATRFLG
ncbi:MAG: cytochrome c3 family protein, partial [Bacteroidales bacterium]|nr:cytochrome c3 family protein [Bacteroidales bacterium]